MADDQNEKSVVAEVAREIEELGHEMEGRNRRARFETAERAESSPAQARQSAGGVEDRSTPEPERLPTVVDISSALKEVSLQVGKFATIPASPQERKLVSEGGPPIMRRKWGPSIAAMIIGLTARKNAGTESVSRKATKEKALAEEAERKPAELGAVAAARREEARQVADEKARAEAAREEGIGATVRLSFGFRYAAAVAEAQARAAVQEAAKRQAAEDGRLKSEEAPRRRLKGG